MSMAGTIEDMRWQIKQQEKEIARLKRFATSHFLNLSLLELQSQR